MTDSTMRGVFAVSTTPFRRDGEQDLDVYAEGVQRVLDAGVDGILALGATGEALTLDPGEREAQVRRLVEVVDGRVPAVVGCMGSRPEACSPAAGDAPNATPPPQHPPAHLRFARAGPPRPQLEPRRRPDRRPL